jgi:hypothetical protein
MVRPTGRWRSAMVRVAGRVRSARLPAVAAVLVVVERALVGEVGSPTALLRALPGLGDAWADPVVPVLALMALVAETGSALASASSSSASRVRGLTATRIFGNSLIRVRGVRLYFIGSPSFGHGSPSKSLRLCLHYSTNCV